MTDQHPQGFPQELLNQPIENRLHYFETKVIAHQYLKEVYEALLQFIYHPTGKSLLLVIGPTGVGKTTLKQRVVKQLIEDAATFLMTNPDHIPVLSLEAIAPESGNFSWKDYFVRALQAADEPMISHKTAYQVSKLPFDATGTLVMQRAQTSPDLRHLFEQCLHYRRPRAVIVDEAQHFKKIASGRRLLDQMDTLKSLANMASTVHVLVGTLDLLSMMNLNAQLARRSTTLYFSRYHAEQTPELKEFKKLLRTFQRHLPFAEEPDLESHYEYFYEQCLGCTGTLKMFLNTILRVALAQEKPMLTPLLWEKHGESYGKLKNMLAEIKRRPISD